MTAPDDSRLAWRPPARISRTANLLLLAPLNALQVALPFLLVPVYLRLVGESAYGLIALNATLLAGLLFVERAFSPPLIREFGRLNGAEGGGAEMARVLATLERAMAAASLIAALAAGALILFAAAGWSDAAAAGGRPVLLMALAVGLNLPFLFYLSGLVGLQRQDLMSALRVAAALAQHGGAALMLLATGGSLAAFFAWQCGVLLAALWAARRLLLRVMPPAAAAEQRFDRETLRRSWRFAAGAALIGLLASAMTQIDKLAVARLSAAEAFAGYAIAFAAASAVFALAVAPLGLMMQPHLAQLQGAGDEAALRRAYHRWCQVHALAILPLAGVLIVFAEPLARLWLGGTGAAAAVAAYLPVAALAAALISLMGPLALLQLAFGWTGLIVRFNAAVLLLLAVLCPLLVQRHGPIAGAWLQAGVGAAYLLVMAPLMHRRILKGSLARWWTRDLLAPALVAAAVFGAAAALRPAEAGPMLQLLLAAAAAAVCVGLLLLVLPDGRAQIRASVVHLLGRPARD